MRAYRITNDKQYFTAAKDVGKALAWGQGQAGGWDHWVDVAHLKPDSVKPERKIDRGSFDDNITQGALSFLMSLNEVVDEPWLSESVNLGLAHMLESQFSNGAWPQWYPLRGQFHDYYTFNDAVINDCIRVMLKAHKIYGKAEYRKVANGRFCFQRISSQLPHRGRCPYYSFLLFSVYAVDLASASGRGHKTF